MYRTILNEIQNLIEKGKGATEQELKLLWNQLSDAITQTEQLNLPPVIKSVCGQCETMFPKGRNNYCSCCGSKIYT